MTIELPSPETSLQAQPGCFALSFPVVGMGASAGGLEALTSLLKGAPLQLDMALVIIQHLDPMRPSLLAEILQKASSHLVREIRDGMQIEQGVIYVLPAGQDVRVEGSLLRLSERSPGEGGHKPIDSFFLSLAEAQGPNAVGVILSGTGNDGSRGIVAIKDKGGLVLVQDPDTAKFSQMPEEALATGYVDQMFAPEGMASLWSAIPRFASQEESEQDWTSPPELSLSEVQYQAIVQLLSRHFRLDFRLYKSSTLKRRILRRMAQGKMMEGEVYLQHLQNTPQELRALYEDLLIHVTSFFRDPEVFAFLAESILPNLILAHPEQEELRIWVAGCSTGEEVYSLLILFHECMETLGRSIPLKVFASDVSEKVIQKARKGFFTEHQVEGLSSERLQRYFQAFEGGYLVTKTLRDQCVFAVHNLAGDPPFSRMDLVSCRNVLIYLSPALQKRVIPLLHFALKPSGFLCVGSAESISPFEQLFQSLDKGIKVFKKLEAISRATPQLTHHHSVEMPLLDASIPLLKVKSHNHSELMRNAERLLLNRYVPCAVLFDENQQVLAIYGDSSPFLKLPSGPLSVQLSKLVREDVLEPLRSLVNKALSSQRAESRTLSFGHGESETSTLQLDVQAVPSSEEGHSYWLLVLQKNRDDSLPKRSWRTAVTQRFFQLWKSSQDENPRIARLQRELHWSKESLRLLEEHLETKILEQSRIHDDLKAASEELLSSNEELQSTNEELETSKEELQSSVEELHTVNEQLSNRNAELHLLNNDLNNLFDNTNIPLLILNKQLMIRRFTPAAAKLFRLIPEDVGRRLGDINLHLKGIPIEQKVLDFMQNQQSGEWEVQSDEGTWFGLRITPYRTIEHAIDGAVITLIDIDLVQRSKDYAQAIVDTVHQPLAIFDRKVELVAANEGFRQTVGRSAGDLEGSPLVTLLPELGSDPIFQGLLAQVLPANTAIKDFVLTLKGSDSHTRLMKVNASRISVGQPKIDKILLSLDDLTLQEEAERIKAQWSMIFEKSEMAIALIEPTSTTIQAANQAFADLYACPRSELAGRSLADFLMADKREQEQKTLDSLDDQACVEYESWHCRGTGQTFPVTVRAQLIRDSQSHVICRMFYVVDRTKYQQADEEKAKAAQAMQAANQAKSDFIANLSHEIRTPLAAILGYTEILATPDHSAMNQEECLARIHRNILSVTEMIDQVLDMSKIEAGKMQVQWMTFALRPELNEVLSLFQSAIEEKGLEVTTDVAATVPLTIKSDPQRLRQILSNVLGNAIKFTLKGSVHIKVDMAPESEVGTDAQLLVFRIQDTGIGISPEQQNQLFLPFSQADGSITRRFGGTGLGLVVSRSLARLLGGDLILKQSAMGEGSLFEFRIKDYARVSPNGSPKDSPQESHGIDGGDTPPLKNVRVLLVEDAPDLQAIYRFFMESYGATVVSAAQGAEALELAKHNVFDIVLMDLQMPVMDGYETNQALRARGLKVPIIALTAHAMEDEQKRMREAKFDGILTKPISGGELIETLKSKLCLEGRI